MGFNKERPHNKRKIKCNCAQEPNYSDSPPPRKKKTRLETPRELTKGWFWRMFPRNEIRNEGYIRMFPRNENRNEGTFACSPGTKTGTRAHSPKPPFYETALLSPSDNWGRARTGCNHDFLCQIPVLRDSTRNARTTNAKIKCNCAHEPNY